MKRNRLCDDCMRRRKLRRVVLCAEHAQIRLTPAADAARTSTVVFAAPESPSLESPPLAEPPLEEPARPFEVSPQPAAQAAAMPSPNPDSATGAPATSAPTNHPDSSEGEMPERTVRLTGAVMIKLAERMGLGGYTGRAARSGAMQGRRRWMCTPAESEQVHAEFARINGHEPPDFRKDRFARFLADRKLSARAVALHLEVPESTLSEWRRGRKALTSELAATLDKVMADPPEALLARCFKTVPVRLPSTEFLTPERVARLEERAKESAKDYADDMGIPFEEALAVQRQVFGLAPQKRRAEPQFSRDWQRARRDEFATARNEEMA